MDKVHILEIWLEGVHTNTLLTTVAGFKSVEAMEKYKLLNPVNVYNGYYRVMQLPLLSL